MSETAHISLLLRSVTYGGAFHGDSLREILESITAEHAMRRPIQGAHTIWELVLHISIWTEYKVVAIEGVAIPPWPMQDKEQDWPTPAGTCDAWHKDVTILFERSERLIELISRMPDARLKDTVPGRKYDFSRLLHGAVQHAVYHSGQIALLKKG